MPTSRCGLRDDASADAPHPNSAALLAPRRRSFAAAVAALAALLPLALPGRHAAALAAGGNDAVLAALRKKANDDLMGEDGAVVTRVNVALDELRRAQTLAAVGEYADARSMLRKGALRETRGDLERVATYLRVQRPTFAQFEGLAVTGGLDAFDDAMRARQTGVAAVTQRDVDLNAKAAVSALEEVAYILGKDKTYEEMRARLEAPVVKTEGGVLEERRDFDAEEVQMVREANRF